MSVSKIKEEVHSNGRDFRLPADTRLGRVRLQVAELDRSVAFYQAVLGVEPVPSNDEDRQAATLTAADGAPLIELVEKPGARPVPARGRLGLYHYAILLPDRASLGRFARHLAATGLPVGASDHLVSEAFYLRDPDGLGIEVYADRPRRDWRYEGGQLAMDTRPLDVGDLMREAGAESWSGMPAGTRVGHMHLHVGDLETARRFYQHGLGLEPVVWSYPGALFLSAGGYHHHLGVNTWAVGAPVAGSEDARLLDWEVIVPDRADAKEAAESLRGNRFEVTDAPGGFRARDPWGVELLIHADESAGLTG
jgi:catechol 2,3-dioxygenase